MKVSVLVLRTYLKKVSPIDEVGLYKFNLSRILVRKMPSFIPDLDS